MGYEDPEMELFVGVHGIKKLLFGTVEGCVECFHTSQIGIASSEAIRFV
jgi:hypothetical protein